MQSTIRNSKACVQCLTAILARLAGAICVVILSATITLASTEFDRQCQRLLPLADEFAKKCLKEAVPFSRTFSKTGEESFRILFSDAYANSHFFMGCMVNRTGGLNYVGLYYKTTTVPLPAFTADEIGFVDFQANAGIKVDGRKYILTAVRQFVTDLIPQRYEAEVRNCELGDMENMAPRADSPTLTFSRTEDHIMTYCWRPDVTCHTDKYRSFFKSEPAPIVFGISKGSEPVFITSNGELLVAEGHFIFYCDSKTRDVYAAEGLVQELCRPPAVQIPVIRVPTILYKY
jgi:hypothetical protein